MKSMQERKNTTLGEFILAAYDTWGKRRARGAVRLAIKAHLIETGGSGEDSASERDSK